MVSVADLSKSYQHIENPSPYGRNIDDYVIVLLMLIMTTLLGDVEQKMLQFRRFSYFKKKKKKVPSLRKGVFTFPALVST